MSSSLGPLGYPRDRKRWSQRLNNAAQAALRHPGPASVWRESEELARLMGLLAEGAGFSPIPYSERALFGIVEMALKASIQRLDPDAIRLASALMRPSELADAVDRRFQEDWRLADPILMNPSSPPRVEPGALDRLAALFAAGIPSQPSWLSFLAQGLSASGMALLDRAAQLCFDHTREPDLLVALGGELRVEPLLAKDPRLASAGLRFRFALAGSGRPLFWSLLDRLDPGWSPKLASLPSPIPWQGSALLGLALGAQPSPETLFADRFGRPALHAALTEALSLWISAPEFRRRGEDLPDQGASIIPWLLSCGASPWGPTSRKSPLFAAAGAAGAFHASAFRALWSSLGDRPLATASPSMALELAQAIGSHGPLSSVSLLCDAGFQWIPSSWKDRPGHTLPLSGALANGRVEVFSSLLDRLAPHDRDQLTFLRELRAIRQRDEMAYAPRSIRALDTWMLPLLSSLEERIAFDEVARSGSPRAASSRI